MDKSIGRPLLALRAFTAGCPIIMGIAACWILILLRNSELRCANFATRYTDTLGFYNFAYLAGPWLVAGTIFLIRLRRSVGFMDAVRVLGAIAAMFTLDLVSPYLTTRPDMVACNLEGYAVWRERFFFDTGVVVVTLGEWLAILSILISSAAFLFDIRKPERNLV